MFLAAVTSRKMTTAYSMARFTTEGRGFVPGVREGEMRRWDRSESVAALTVEQPTRYACTDAQAHAYTYRHARTF